MIVAGPLVTSEQRAQSWADPSSVAFAVSYSKAWFFYFHFLKKTKGLPV